MPDKTHDLNFGEVCRAKFTTHAQAKKAAPFHKDKREYDKRADEVLDAYLDWLELGKP